MLTYAVLGILPALHQYFAPFHAERGLVRTGLLCAAFPANVRHTFLTVLPTVHGRLASLYSEVGPFAAVYSQCLPCQEWAV